MPRREFSILTTAPEILETTGGNAYMRRRAQPEGPIRVDVASPHFGELEVRIVYPTPRGELSVFVDGAREAQQIVRGLIAAYGYQAIYGPSMEEEPW